MESKFSIIVPTFNRGRLIQITIDSILSQTYRNFEVIVIDDGSTDNTEEIIKSLYASAAGIKYHKIKNSERGAARNHGARISSGDYVSYFDSDDVMLPNHLDEANTFIHRKNNPGLFHLNYEIKNTTGKIIGIGPGQLITANKELIRGNFLSCNGVIIRRDIALQNVFVEDRTLAGMEDWELWLRLAAQHEIHMVSSITTVIINHDDRSVLQTEKTKLIRRVETLMQHVLGNPSILKYYGKDISKFKSSCATYIALHLALTKKDRLETLRYLMKGVRVDYTSIFTRRFLAIIKHFI